MSQRAPLSRAKEPDWCVAAKGVGTYISRVLMPKATCVYAKASRVAAALLVLRGRGVLRERKYSTVMAVTDAIPKIR